MLSVVKGVVFATVSPNTIQIRKAGGEILAVQGEGACRLLGEIIAGVKAHATAEHIASRLSESTQSESIVETIQGLISAGVLEDDGSEQDNQSEDVDPVDVYLIGPSVEIGDPLTHFLRSLPHENANFHLASSIEDLFSRVKEKSYNPSNSLSVVESGSLLLSWYPRLDFTRNEMLNNFVVSNGMNWLPVDFFSEGVGVIGPFVHGGGKPCYECYQKRRLSNRGDSIPIDVEYFQFQRLSRVAVDPPTDFPFLPQYLFGSIAAEVGKLLVEHTLPSSYQSIQLIDVLGGTVETQRVLTLPRCDVCRKGELETTAHWVEYSA